MDLHAEGQTQHEETVILGRQGNMESVRPHGRVGANGGTNRTVNALGKQHTETQTGRRRGGGSSANPRMRGKTFKSPALQMLSPIRSIRSSCRCLRSEGVNE